MIDGILKLICAKYGEGEIMNAKGFSLVELLMVLAVLALVLLIITPWVLTAINDARKGAFSASSYGLVKTAENHYYRRTVNGNSIEEVVYKFNNGAQSTPVPATMAPLDYSGERPKRGKIVVTEEGEIYMALKNGLFCSYKSYDESEVTVRLIEDMEDECSITALDLSPTE